MVLHNVTQYLMVLHGTSSLSLTLTAGKYSKVPMVEEEQCDDLLHFMRLLIHLIRNSVEIGMQWF